MIDIQITNSYYYWIFFIIMVFLGAYVIINLILAIVAINFLKYHIIVIYQ